MSAPWLDMDDTFMSNAEHRRRPEVLLRSVRRCSMEEQDENGDVMEHYALDDADRPGLTPQHLQAALVHAVLALGSES